MLRQGREGWIRAYDKATGAKVWERDVVPTPHGSPMTYRHQGKQYLVVAAGGMEQPGELLAFALP
jgi:quinoprotein glucose dehydrogenase